MISNDNITPENIDEIIIRFLEGIESEEEATILFNWLKADPANQVYFDEVNTTYQASVTLNRYTQQKTDDAWARLSHEIEIDKPKKQPIRLSISWTTGLRIAASICFLILSIYGILQLQPQGGQHQLTTIKNSYGKNTRILLPDSSVVMLNTNSTLEYPASFGKGSRDVTLKGEAFFDIRKGKKPFRVNTENILIEVKGTRFNVQACKNDKTVKTTLEEGQVHLSVHGKEQVYSLKPGDQAILNTKINQVTLKKVDPSYFTAWKEEVLVFDNTPLEQIIAKLENRFRVNISADTSITKRERISMTIENETIEEILDLIVLSSGLNVKHQDGEIILYE